MESKVKDELGTVYWCKFRGIGNDKFFKNHLIQWTVNDISTKGYSQFRINHWNSSEGDRVSAFSIKNPVALRGPTYIKCSVKGVSGTFFTRS